MLTIHWACWKHGAHRFAEGRTFTNLQFAKNALSIKHIKWSAIKQGMPVQKIRSNSIQDHRDLQDEGSEIRLVEGIFWMGAIIELKSEQREAMYSFPGGLRDGRWSDHRNESPVLPMAEKRWRNFSWTLPNFAVALPLVWKKAPVLSILKDASVWENS